MYVYNYQTRKIFDLLFVFTTDLDFFRNINIIQADNCNKEIRRVFIKYDV